MHFHNTWFVKWFFFSLLRVFCRLFLKCTNTMVSRDIRHLIIDLFTRQQQYLTAISNLEEGNTSYWLISGLHWISNFPFTNGRDFQSMGVSSEKISSTKREEGWKYPMIGCYWNYLYLRYLESKMSIKWKDVFRYEISRISCNDVRASFFCRASSLNAHILTQRGHVDFP